MAGYKGAFKCGKWNGKKPCDCPCWTSITETNGISGEEKITADCLFNLLPHLMIEVIRASNRPANAVLEVRNEMAKGFQTLAGLHELAERQLLLTPKTDNVDSQPKS